MAHTCYLHFGFDRKNVHKNYELNTTIKQELSQGQCTRLVSVLDSKTRDMLSLSKE